jgi:hypothetical protein
VFILGNSGHALAAGEILALQTSGTQYCPGTAPIRFTPSTDRPLFIKFNGDGTLSGYVDTLKNMPDFMLNIDSDQIGIRTFAYHADFLVDSYNHISLIGRIKFDKLGFVKTINGTAVRAGLGDNCYALAKITGKRIN